MTHGLFGGKPDDRTTTISINNSASLRRGVCLTQHPCTIQSLDDGYGASRWVGRLQRRIRAWPTWLRSRQCQYPAHRAIAAAAPHVLRALPVLPLRHLAANHVRRRLAAKLLRRRKSRWATLTALSHKEMAQICTRHINLSPTSLPHHIDTNAR